MDPDNIIPEGAASCPVCLSCYLDPSHAASCCEMERRCTACTDGEEHRAKDCPNDSPCGKCQNPDHGADECPYDLEEIDEPDPERAGQDAYLRSL
jgi:hypothetical protein